MNELAAFGLGVLATVVLGLPYFIALKSRELKRANDELRDQIAKRRHTYPTAEGLEDAVAVVIELILRWEAEQEYGRARLGQLQDILGMIRSGPLEYDTERPNDRPPWMKEYLQRVRMRSNGRVKERTRQEAR